MCAKAKTPGAMSINVTREHVLKQIGYKSRPEEKLLQLIDQLLESGRALLNPLMRFKEIARSEDLPLFFNGAPLSYIALASIGAGLESRVQQFFDSKRAMEGYLLDTIGSLAVMHAGNALWAEMMKDAGLRGFKKGLRRAPGCEGVPMELQKWIVETFGDPHLGIHLTQSYMLVPRKSFAFLGRFGGKGEALFPARAALSF